MASAELREELYCSICLEVFTDPVTLRCGHNFCRNCIECVLRSQERSGVYACPDCREEFQDRPALYRNITLRNIAERFLAVTEEDAATFCAYCTDSQVPAIKSCLHCNAMLCNKHLEIHSKAPEHAVSEPSDCLKAPKCSIHKQIFKYYCADDSVCICATCLTSEHRGHQAKDIDEASEKKKATLRNILEKLTLKEADVEKRLQGLEEHQANVQAKASSEKKRVAALLGDVVRQIGDLQTRVLNEITRQEEKMSMTVSGQIHQMASKKDKLHKNMRYIEELCNKADALTILQEHITDYGNTEEGDMEDGDGDDQQVHDKGDLDGARSSEMVLAGLYGIINVVKEKLHSQKASGLLLNVATAANNIKISDDLKGVISIKEEEDRPETPLRFQKCQVVSTQSFSSGRHYWEVLTSESGGWRVGMTYPSIQREGAKSAIGENDKSWCLRTFHGNYAVRHCGIDHCLARKVLGCRFRISLDYEAGQLSFYGLGNPVTHLYTFTTTFTEPLHAALYVMGGKAWVRITS